MAGKSSIVPQKIKKIVQTLYAQVGYYMFFMSKYVLFEKSLFMHRIIAEKYGYSIELKSNRPIVEEKLLCNAELPFVQDMYNNFNKFLDDNKFASIKEKIEYGKNLFFTTSDADEDIILYIFLRSFANGFYIDCGANDPNEYNATKIFYDYGWHGINIEPVEELICLYNKFRQRDINIRCCVSDTNRESNFFEGQGGAFGLSTLERSHREHVNTVEGWENIEFREYTVQCRTLDSILENTNVQEIHLLKIDVEGHELNVLNGIDLNKYRPIMIMLEVNPKIDLCTEHLAARGWSFLLWHKHNCFYIRDDMKETILSKI